MVPYPKVQSGKKFHYQKLIFDIRLILTTKCLVTFKTIKISKQGVLKINC